MAQYPMVLCFAALVGLASAANPEGQAAAGSWQDWITPKTVLIACFVAYRLYGMLGGGGDGGEAKAFGEKFLVENKLKEGVVSLPSGLQYKVLRSGDGDSHPLPGSPCACPCSYTCACTCPYT